MREFCLISTLIVWGGEFGRQPTAENAQGTGRDHNAYGFTMWMAGGGIQGGQSFGATDDIEKNNSDNPMTFTVSSSSKICFALQLNLK